MAIIVYFFKRNRSWWTNAAPCHGVQPHFWPQPTIRIDGHVSSFQYGNHGTFVGTAKTCIEQPMIQVAASLTVEEQKEDVACWADFVEACQLHLLNQLKSSWTNETPIQFAIFQCITMYFSPVSWYTVFPGFACLQTLLRVAFSNVKIISLDRTHATPGHKLQ